MDLLRGQIAFASGLGSDAPPLLLKAAKRLESLDLDLARETYLSAWMAALFAGRLAGAGDLLEVSRAARALPPPAHPPRPVDLLLDGLALLVTDGPAAAAPTLRQAVQRLRRRGHRPGGRTPVGLDGSGAASAVWDDDAWRAIARPAGPARPETGALDQLPIDLGALGTNVAWTRRLRGGRVPDRGDRCGLRGDREPRRPVRRDDPRVACAATRPRPSR